MRDEMSRVSKRYEGGRVSHNVCVLTSGSIDEGRTGGMGAGSSSSGIPVPSGGK